MDNQYLQGPKPVPEEDSLSAAVPVSDNNFVSQYATNGGVYSMQSLEVNSGQHGSTPEPEPASQTPLPRFSFSKRKAMVVSISITLAVLLLTGATMSFLLRRAPDTPKTASLSPQQDIELKGTDQSKIPTELQGAGESLLVNGDVVTRGTLKISNNGAVTVIKSLNTSGTQTINLPAGSGTLCVDSNNCGYASADSLAALQAQVAALGPVPAAGVNSLNDQRGAVSIQGSTNQITVNTTNGVVTLSTPQNLDSNANVQFNSLTVLPTGQITSNKLVQTGAGNNVNIDAGSDDIIFTANGQTYVLPSGGGTGQTICTSGATCAGAGTGDIAQGGNSFGTAITIGTNDTQNLQLETDGTTRLTISSTGNATFTGNVAAVAFSGDGSGLTSLSATNITTGALADARLSVNVSLLGQTIESGEITNGSVTGTDIANTTIANSNLINSGLTVTAGSGLSNGGLVSLGGTISLDIGQGDGITINANDVAVDGTVCRTSGNCAGVGGTGDILQGGNSFGSTMTIGTNDGQALALETGGLTRLTISSAGDALFSGNLDTNGSLTVGSANQFVISSAGVITSGTWNGSTIGIGYGGTGLATTPANGQLLIGNGTGYSLATLTNSDGTVDILNGAGSIDISVPRADQCSTCADHTLSNLADIIAINKSLLPASAGAINLGGPSVPYSTLYLSGTSSTPASNNFTITGNATSGRTINLPDADGTICLLETCIRLQAGSPGTQQTGHINISGNVLATNLVLGGAATVNSLAPAASTALTLGATGVGQTTNLQGNSISFTNGSATYTFDSTSGTRTICDDSGNCAGTGGGVIASGGSAYNLPVFTSANTIANSIFSQNAGATIGTVTGTLQVTGATIAGTGALTVSSTGGGNALNLSSGSGTLGLTGSTAIIQRVGNSLTLDINSGANSTLTVTNSNVSNVANLSIEGGLNIGSGQTYKVNNVDINTGGTLNNVAYLDQANAFSNGGNTTFAGTINSQTISSSANFTGTLAVRGANALTLGQASTNTGSIIFQNSSGSNTVTLRASNTNPGSSVVFTLPSAPGTAGYCLTDSDGAGTLGFVNCSGGLGLAGSQTDNRLLKFTSSGTAVTDSSIDDNGSVVTIQGSSNSLSVAGGTVASVGNNSISLGTASSTTGGISFKNETTANSVVLQSGATANNYSLILPTDQGTGCLRNDGSGQLAYFACISSGGGGGGSDVTSNNATTDRVARWVDGGNFVIDDSSIRDNGARVGVGVAVDATAVLTVGSSAAFKVTNAGALTVAGITNSTTAFDNGGTGITNTGSLAGVSTLAATGLLQTNANGQALSLSGAPTNSATQSLLSLGGAIASGNNSVDGGTYVGINAPASGAGSVADFINFQTNGTSRLRVTSAGNVTAGTYNGVTISGTGTLSTGTSTLTLTGNSTINQSLTTSSSVQFSSLSLTNALTAANGGTGTDTSGALAGAALIFNATTGRFEANQITSSDNSILISNTDGSIDLVVSSCTTCASTDLSNLAATTNINSTLRAQTGVDIGAASNPFRDAYIYGSSSTPASNNFRLTGTATGARTITLPDASGTACLTNTCVMLQGGGHTPQSGYIDISNDLAVGGNFTLGGTATINTLAPAASTALVLGATGSGQTSRLQGTAVSFISGGITYNFSHSGSGTHTLCDDTGNCAGAGGGVTASGGAAFYMPVFNSANTLINSIISQDAGVGATTATVNGKLVVAAANTTGTTLAISNSSLNGNNSNLANFSFTNANSTASATIVNGIAVSPTGSINSNPGSNILNGLRLNNVTPITNNSFYALNVGTGYDDILRYNGTSVINGGGAVQNLNGQAASYYLNASNINAGTLSVDRGGTGVVTFTSNGVLYGNGTGAIQATAAGTTGQCFVATTGSAPSWGSCAGVGSGVTLQAAYDNSSPASILLSSAKDFKIDTTDDATDSNILFDLTCVTCSAGGGRFAIQDSGTDVFSVNPNSTIVIGTASNNMTLTAGTYEPILNGTARHAKKVKLTPEYPGAVLDAASDGTCSSANNGTMTSGYQSGITGFENTTQNYFSWTSSQGSAQCYNVIVQVPVPSDWAAWDSTPVTLNAYTTNTTNGTVHMQILDSTGATESDYNYEVMTPSSTTTWQARNGSPNTLGGNYTTGQYMTVRIRVSSLSSAEVRIGNITLNYLSKY